MIATITGILTQLANSAIRAKKHPTIVIGTPVNTPSNVDFKIHEDNQNQGAWGPEERIHFYSEEGVPECLKRQMTAGRGDLYGSINCKEFCEELRQIAINRGL